MLPEDALMLKDFVSAYKAWEKSVQLDLSHSQKKSYLTSTLESEISIFHI